MNKILIIASKPNSNKSLGLAAWDELAGSLRILAEQNTGVFHLGGGSLLIEEDSGMPALGPALKLCESLELSYRTLFIEGHTEWRRDFNKE